jgi:GNAT superfamily N-acetyltransferase
MSSFVISLAQASDWQRTRTIRLRALTDTPDAFWSTLDREMDFSDEDWRQRLVRTDAATFLASNSQADIGIVVVAANEDGQAGLYSMWVAPEQRGKGIGDGLIGAAVSWAGKQGFERISLGVGDFNAAAVRLYARHGFVPTGEAGTLPPPRTHITEHTRALMLKPTT